MKTGRPIIPGGRTARALMREGRVQAAVDILREVSIEFGCDIMAMRVKPFPEKVQKSRVEFMRRASKVADCVVVADLLHCDQTTVRSHLNEKYRNLKREANDARDARSRAAARENLRFD